MRKFASMLILLAVLALIGIGCSSDRTMITRYDNTPTFSAITGYPSADDVVSATLYVYVNQASGHTVSLHRITGDWDEMTVTWNNFGGSYDATVVGSFTSDDTAYKAIDITNLVKAWLDGTYDNFGVLLEQDDMTFPRTMLFSRDAASLHPYLEICYTNTNCEQTLPVADSYIYELYPDGNAGDAINLNIGWLAATDLEKHALIRFDLPEEPEPAAIGDTVWIDTDRDGIQDTGEPGFPGVTVNLYDCQNNFIASMVTDADGFYLFDNLTPGDYYVEFIEPEAYNFTLQDQGSDDAVDSDVDVLTGRTICTTLDPGEADMTWDAGLYRVPQEGCSLTIGFWKTHAGFGPQDNVVSPLLPIWLGTASGNKSIEVTDSTIAHDILVMKTYGKPSNGITKLYAQLLAAKLNMAGGASDTDIGNALTIADEFLAEYDWTDWNNLNRRQKKMVNSLKSTFDDYNNGDIGPGHCD